jgi:hypothetical protein
MKLHGENPMPKNTKVSLITMHSTSSPKKLTWKVVNARADPLYPLWAFLQSKMTPTANLFAPNPELLPSELKIQLNG